MIKSIEVTGKTEEAAIASALEQLGLTRDEVSVEIVERAKSGFLGLGASPAVVKIMYEVADEPAKPAEQQRASVPAASAAVGEQAEKTRQFLTGLFEHMDTQAEITVTQQEDGRINVVLSGEHMGVVIGRRGETLDAIQHLANYCVNKGAEKRAHISVDAEDYRKKREDSLVRLAEKMAEKAIKYKRSMTLEPMNSYERHIIHTALQDYEGVTTASTGSEPNRRVVVSYTRSSDKSGSSNVKEWN